MGKRLTTKQKMIERLAPHFKAAFPGQSFKIELFPAVGYWRQTKADVMQFTGYVQLDGNSNLRHDIGCWESMTDCLRRGFEFHDKRKEPRNYASFMINAKPKKTG